MLSAVFSFSISRSKSRILRTRVGNFGNAATARSQAAFSNAGEPDITAPSGISWEVPLWAVIIALSPTSRWPAKPACPPTQTPFPRRVDPASPTWAAKTECSPTWAPCPICTRLSSFAPRRIIVSPTAARSMVVLAPTSTSSSIITRPVWQIL